MIDEKMMLERGNWGFGRMDSDIPIGRSASAFSGLRFLVFRQAHVL